MPGTEWSVQNSVSELCKPCENGTAKNVLTFLWRLFSTIEAFHHSTLFDQNTNLILGGVITVNQGYNIDTDILHVSASECSEFSTVSATLDDSIDAVRAMHKRQVRQDPICNTFLRLDI